MCFGEDPDEIWPEFSHLLHRPRKREMSWADKVVADSMIRNEASIDEIRIALGEPDWEPTSKQLRIMELVRKTKHGRRAGKRRKGDFSHEEEVKGDEPAQDVEASRNRGRPSVHAVPRNCQIFIDGSNVIGLDGELRTKILAAVMDGLDSEGYRPKAFVDKSIFNWLRKSGDADGEKFLASKENEGSLFVSPNKAEADGQLLQLARYERDVHIITNDRFRDYVEMHPWLIKEANRLHGINLVPVGGARVRILVAGFDLNIVIEK